MRVLEKKIQAKISHPTVIQCNRALLSLINRSDLQNTTNGGTVKLSKRFITNLAEMICGRSGGNGGFDRQNFIYRSSSYLTEFFRKCDMDYVHPGTTRKFWVEEVLDEINEGPSTDVNLPSDGMLRVIEELLDAGNFENGDNTKALADINSALKRDCIEVYLDSVGRVFIRNLTTQTTTAQTNLRRRTWSPKEAKRRKEISDYLNRASEDEFIENVLLPIFSQCGYRRISVAGHKDKLMEFGKDLWMKYQLPTSHTIYFGLQAKRGKLDSASKGKNENISEVLSQIKMALLSPIWDPEINKRVLIDHIFIACGGEITKQAKQWLGEHLDLESRRHVLFMEREEILDLSVTLNLKFPFEMDNKEEIENNCLF